jgi:hypothetical protein
MPVGTQANAPNPKHCARPCCQDWANCEPCNNKNTKPLPSCTAIAEPEASANHMRLKQKIAHFGLLARVAASQLIPC